MTFNPVGGSVSPRTSKTNANGRLSSLPTPTKSGYTFSGWYTLATGGVAVTTNYVFTYNAQIFARWTPIKKQYTVTFHSNGGSVSPSSSVTKTDGRLSSLPTPTRSGYTFDGWYTASSGGSEVTTATVFTKNSTVYAHWTSANIFRVTFDAMGGSVSPGSAATDSSGQLSSLPTPTRKNYYFDGWYTAREGGERITTGTVFRAAATVYAHWSEEGELKDSGSLSLSKLSEREITNLLQSNPNITPEGPFSKEPSVAAPYAPGKLADKALDAALDRFNAIRRIAGLPGVKLDSSMNDSAQYGAVLLAASEFSHTPAQPGDMDSSFFSKARSATGSSNIHYRYTSAGDPSCLVSSVDSFMDDSDASNVSRVGHRRWQLNPTMGKIGFGYAIKDNAGYVCEKVFDTSGSGVDYEFISWPASGHFPQALFGKDTAWSVTLNPARYETPSRSRITVTLYREADKKKWTFSGSSYKAAASGAYYTVDTGNTGVSNCIIFRPDGIAEYDGPYTVTIEGLRNLSGQEVSLSYRVDFFGADVTHTVTFDPNGGSLESGSSRLTAGKDGRLSSLPVPTRGGYTFEGWYTKISGGERITSGTVFSANATVYAHWSSAFTITLDPNGGKVSPESLTTDSGGRVSSLPTPSRDNTQFKGWFTAREGGTQVTSATVFTRNSTVYAQWTEAKPAPVLFLDVPPGMYYSEAVEWAVSAGITTGTSDTTFDPDVSCSRGQIVTFLWRAAGSPKPQSSSSPFTDVQPGVYYYDAVLWAVEKGITQGTSATTFGPDVIVGRDQTVTFLYRAAGSPAVPNDAPFTDVPGDAYYAAAVRWAVSQGITTGTGEDSFSPGMQCSRGQIVTFLFRAK